MPSTYVLEYAKSGRGKCAACKEPIADKTLRISVQSANGEGEKNYTNNRHLQCLTARVAKNALDAHGGECSKLPGFDDLKEEDQDIVKKRFEELAKEGSGGGKKAPAKRKAKKDEDEGGEDEGGDEGEAEEKKPAKKAPAKKAKKEEKPKEEKEKPKKGGKAAPKKAAAKKKKAESEEEEADDDGSEEEADEE